MPQPRMRFQWTMPNEARKRLNSQPETWSELEAEGEPS